MADRLQLIVPPPRGALSFFNNSIEHSLLATVFFMPLSLTLTTVCLVIGSSLWLIKMLYFRQMRLRVLTAEKSVIVYAIVCLLTVVLSPEPAYSWYNYWEQFGRYIALYYLLINNMKTRLQVKRLCLVLLVATTIVAIYGLVQYYWGMDIKPADWVDGSYFPEINERIFSTWLNPNLMAGYLVVMISLALGPVLYSKTWQHRWGLGGFIAICLICLWLTWSRGAWLSLLLVVTLVGFLRNRHMLWMLAVALIVLIKTYEPLAARLLSVLHPTADSSSNMRLGIWSGSLAMAEKHPLWGWGWGTFRDFYPKFGYYVLDPGVIIYHAHNTYLHLLAETGVIGLLTFLVVVGLHLKLAWRKYRRLPSGLAKGLLLGLMTAMIGLLLAGFSDHLLFNIKMFMVFWLLCGLIVMVE